MRIGDVATRAGIPASTLRYYEEIGLIAAPPRISGQRDYDESVFEVLDIIQMTQKAGFSLKQIHQLLHEHEIDTALPARWRYLAKQKLIEVEQTIQHFQTIHTLLEQGLTCECSELNDCQLFA